MLSVGRTPGWCTKLHSDSIKSNVVYGQKIPAVKARSHPEPARLADLLEPVFEPVRVLLAEGVPVEVADDPLGVIDGSVQPVFPMTA